MAEKMKYKWKNTDIINRQKLVLQVSSGINYLFLFPPGKQESGLLTFHLILSCLVTYILCLVLLIVFVLIWMLLHHWIKNTISHLIPQTQARTLAWSFTDEESVQTLKLSGILQRWVLPCSWVVAVTVFHQEGGQT